MLRVLRSFAVGAWGLAAIWVGVMSGLLSLAREAYGLYSGAAPPRNVFWSCAWIAGFFALCLAWLREHLKYRDAQDKIEQAQRPKFLIKIEQTMLGARGQNSSTSPIFLVASIRSAGAPSAALNWKLEVTVPGGTGPKLASRQKTPNRIEMDDGETAIFSEGDALYERTLVAIPNGGFAIGVLAFLVEVRTSALELPGTILKLSCDDVYGQTHEFQTTINEVKTPSLKSLSFTGLPIRLEEPRRNQLPEAQENDDIRQSAKLEIIFQPDSEPFIQMNSAEDGSQNRLYRVGVISPVTAEVVLRAEKVELGGRNYSNVHLHNMHDTSNKTKRVRLYPGVPDYWDVVLINAQTNRGQLTHIQENMPFDLSPGKQEFRLLAITDKDSPTAKIVTIEPDKALKQFNLRD